MKVLIKDPDRQEEFGRFETVNRVRLLPEFFAHLRERHRPGQDEMGRLPAVIARRAALIVAPVAMPSSATMAVVPFGSMRSQPAK